ncbi:hypothetical protein [Streptomyces endophytica]|uniref:Uncharacterized protein n=1 Tax=Streptomyces endophytica TaxID=2991496 RepID=A0ABY6PBX6_9ACTN|nr:hypothetical protein [Streptomyces endophytica]UZJ31276.1 hypothetical protein OJ254_14295 [Streptomyces endophytica]
MRKSMDRTGRGLGCAPAALALPAALSPTAAAPAFAFDLRPALRSGGDRLAFRFSAHRPGYLLGALFVQTDTRR